MKTIGLIGGMSWESTLEYYRIMNQEVKDRLGGLHSAKILLYSVDFQEIEGMMSSGDWEGVGNRIKEAARTLEQGGAELLLICTNTIHKVAPKVQEAVTIELLHIASVTARESKRRGMKKLGLLGTAFTMEQEFYKDRLKQRHGIDVVIPDKDQRAEVHDIIFEELCLGKIRYESKRRMQDIIDGMVAKGAEGIILGCTELPLLVKQEEVKVPLLDTASLHARAAVDAALE